MAMPMVLGLVILLSACSSTIQTRSVETSGFMTDYHQLRKGEAGEARLVYINPSTDFGKYDKILIKPVQVYAAPKSKLAKLPNEDVQSLVNYLHATVREQLKGDYVLVDRPGSGVMSLRVAITEAKGSKVVMDTLSSVMPPGIAVSAIKQLATGTPASVGSARVEMEMLDSVTGERLIAAMDERAGRKYTGRFDKWKKWQDAKDAYDYWAQQLRARLTELRTEGKQ